MKIREQYLAPLTFLINLVKAFAVLPRPFLSLSSASFFRPYAVNILYPTHHHSRMHLQTIFSADGLVFVSKANSFAWRSCGVGRPLPRIFITCQDMYISCSDCMHWLQCVSLWRCSNR